MNDPLWKNSKKIMDAQKKHTLMENILVILDGVHMHCKISDDWTGTAITS